jgi:hypothetical protein
VRLPAALDAEHFARGGIPSSLFELRGRCPLMCATGSPHHLCLHLCYYREYDPVRPYKLNPVEPSVEPLNIKCDLLVSKYAFKFNVLYRYNLARQLFVLRTRAAAAAGTASMLDGWRAELRVAPQEQTTPKKKQKRTAKRRRGGGGGGGNDDDEDYAADDLDNGDEYDEEYDDDNDDDDEDVDDEADGGGGGGGGGGGSKRKKGKGKKPPSGPTAGGWLAGKSLPWRVAFVVGLYKLNSVHPQLEKRLVSTLLAYEVKTRFQSLLFKCNLCCYVASPDGAEFSKASEVLDAIGVDCRGGGLYKL